MPRGGSSPASALLDGALRLETLNGYSCLGDFSEARERLAGFGRKN